MTGQARCCGSVGSANRLENQRSMTGWNRDSGIPEIYPKTDLGEGLTQRGPAHRDDPLNRLADLVVRRRRPRRDADRQPAIRQPAFAPLLRGMNTDRAIADAPIVHGDTGSILDVVGRDLLMADCREVGRVARVVAADQMVSKVRKCSPRDSAPQRRVMLLATSAAMASDSPDSIVVWLATPTCCRSRSGSKPGVILPVNCSRNPSLVPRPSMYSQTTRASFISRTTTYFPPGYLLTWLDVAFVSSW